MKDKDPTFEWLQSGEQVATVVALLTVSLDVIGVRAAPY